MKTTKLLLMMLLTLTGVLSANAQEAYCAVVYGNTDDGQTGLTATYYYDNQRSNWEKTVAVDEVSPDYLLMVDDATIIFDSSFANYYPTSTLYWFSNLPAKRKVIFEGWENLNTSQVENMCGMFESLGYWYDPRLECSGTYLVENLDLSHFDTRNVTDMSSMLNNVVGVDYLDISSFTINPDADTELMMANSAFQFISLPTTADNLADDAFKDTPTVGGRCELDCPYGFTPLSYVVNGDCESDDVTCLWGQDFGIGYENYQDGANTHFVEGEGYNGTRGIMVQNAKNSNGDDWATQLFVYTPNHVWKTGEKYRFRMKVRADKEAQIIAQAHGTPVNYITWEMLDGSYNVTTQWQSIDCEGVITSAQNNMQTIAFILNVLKEANNFYFDDISWDLVVDSGDSFAWKGGRFIIVEPEAYVHFSTDEKTMTFYYDYEKSNREGRTFPLNTQDFSTGWEEGSGSVTQVVFHDSFANARPTSCHNWFYNMSALKSITGIENLKTDKVTNMAYMFNGCSGLESLDLSGFTFTSESSTMLNYCSSLRKLIISNSANNMDDDACYGVGSQSNPCTLIYPNGFTPEGATSVGNGVYQWKAGFFKDAEIEAYAQLSTDETTLTFYYDRLRSTRFGTTFDLDTGFGPEWLKKRTSVTSVVFDSSFADARPTSCEIWFYEMKNLIAITGIEYLKTDEVTNMGGMFYDCSSLTNLDLSGFNTSKVTNMGNMFDRCSSLTSLDLSGFNTEKVTEMGEMFEFCSSLTSLDLSGFNTANVTNMRNMFYGCSSLESLNVFGFNILKVTDMYSMFANCSSLKTLDLSTFTFNSGTDTENFLEYCGALTKLIISISANNINENAFYGVASSRAPCVLICPDGFTPEGANTFDSYFKWKFGYFKDGEPEPYVVLNGSRLTFYYDAGSGARPGTEYTLNTGSNRPGWYNNCTSVTTVVFHSSFADARPTSCYSWFNGLTNLTTIRGIENLKTDNVTRMSYMFQGCSSLKDLDLSGFTFSSTNSNYTSNFLKGCSGLKELIIPQTASRLNDNACSGVGTSSAPCVLIYPNNITPTSTSNGILRWKTGYFKDGEKQPYAVLNGSMLTFYYDAGYGARSGTTYHLNTGNDSPAWRQFRASVTSVEFTSSFADASPTSCFEWFANMSNLTTIKGIKYLKTDAVTTMYGMFGGCSSLTSLDLSRFTFPSSGTSYFLRNCTSLQTLTISATADRLLASACTGVGTETAPCTLIYPEEFTFTPSETGNGWFKWKGGCFKNAPKAYAVLNGSALKFYYDGNYNYCPGIVFYMNTGQDNPGWYDKNDDITSVEFVSSFTDVRPTSCYQWFANMANLTTISGIEYLKTDEVLTMQGMFGGCVSLTSLDVSGFNTANVTDMNYMFAGCASLTSLDLSSFNFTSASTSYLLNNCTSLQTLTVPVTANLFNTNACSGVGTIPNPCTLIYPSGTELTKTEETSSYFVWKSGYFKDAGLPGDANEDGHVTVADVMLAVNKVLGKPLTLFNEKNADINNDNRITVADVMGIVKLVLNSGRASAPRNAFQSMSDAMAVTAKGNELTLHLTGTGSYTASQMMLTLPEGCRLESAQMVSSRSNGHSVQTSDLGNGQYRVVVYGASGLPFGNSCTDLVRLNVKGSHHGDVAVSDIQVVDYFTNTFLLSDVSGIATGIDSIGSDTSDDGDWYTTQGQKVTTPTRGVYIRNGKKVVVR